VEACKSVPDEVKKKMREIVLGLQQNLIKNYNEEESAEASHKEKKQTMKHLTLTVLEIYLRKEYLTHKLTSIPCFRKV